LADAVVLLVRVSAVHFDALVDVTSASNASTATYFGVSGLSTQGISTWLLRRCDQSRWLIS
jgi:hypothetical protein